MITIRHILGKREPFSVRPAMSVREVVDYLVDKRVGAVAVCDGALVVGVFSERDLLHRVIHAGLDPQTTPIANVMTKDVFAVTTDTTYHDAMTLMLDKNFRHLAVRDEDDRFRGFVSMRELLEIGLSEARDLIARLNDNYYQHEFDTKRNR